MADATEIFAVQLTAPAAGAVACVLMAGGDAAGVAGALERISGRPNLEGVRQGAAVLGRLRDGTGGVIDDALLVRVAPARWEIQLHGGTAVVEATLEELARLGVRVLTAAQAAGEKLFGTILEGEVLLALGGARTLTVTRLLLAQAAAWRGWIEHWSGFLSTPAGAELWQFHAAIQWRLARSRALAAHYAPPRIAIIGPPNAGKSTLANALLGRPVAITSDIPGTTRDWVDAPTIFAGPNGVQVAVTLIDTAGIRETADAIEEQSIARSHQQAHAADAIIALFDATREPTAEELLLAAPRRSCPVIVAANKADLAVGVPSPLAGLRPIAVSAKTAAGLDTLMARVLETLDVLVFSEEPIAFTDRHRGLLSALAMTDDTHSCQALLSSLF